MTRPITPHKGGRTVRAPEARMTPQERGRLDAVLQRRGVKYVDWLIGNVNRDYEQSGGNEMSSTLDDFFGDSRTKTPNCFHCGKTDGKLDVVSYDAYGPTLWVHPNCKKEVDAEREKVAQARRDSVARSEAMDEWEEPNRPKR